MEILVQGPKVLLFSAFFVNFGFESALQLHYLRGWTIFLRVVVQNDIFHLRDHDGGLYFEYTMVHLQWF